MKRLAQIGAVAVVCALLAGLVWDMIHAQGGHVAAGDKAPAWSLNRVDTDAPLSLAAYKGKPVVLNFWQSYCVPCAGEAKTLTAAEAKYRAAGVQFVGMDELDLRNYAQAFMKRHNMTWPSVADNGEVAGRYGVTGTPETFFINRHGVVVDHIALPVTKATLDSGIKKALAR